MPVFIVGATRMSSQLIAGALKRYRNNFNVCALTGGSNEAFRELKNYHAHVAVISAELEDRPCTGFKVPYQLRASKLRIPVVMLLDSAKRDLAVDTFQGGARGIYCRDRSFNAFPKCIRCVYEGQIWVSNDELEFLLDVLNNLNISRINIGRMTLRTPRESDVVRLIAEGMKNQEISHKLNLREPTVRNCVFGFSTSLICQAGQSWPCMHSADQIRWTTGPAAMSRESSFSCL